MYVVHPHRWIVQSIEIAQYGGIIRSWEIKTFCSSSFSVYRIHIPPPLKRFSKVEEQPSFFFIVLLIMMMTVYIHEPSFLAYRWMRRSSQIGTSSHLYTSFPLHFCVVVILFLKRRRRRTNFTLISFLSLPFFFLPFFNPGGFVVYFT